MSIKQISDIELTRLLTGFHNAQDHAVREGLCTPATADMIKQIGDATIETLQGLPNIGKAQAMGILKLAQDFGIMLGGAVAYGGGDKDSLISQAYQRTIEPVLLDLTMHTINEAVSRAREDAGLQAAEAV